MQYVLCIVFESIMTDFSASAWTRRHGTRQDLYQLMVYPSLDTIVRLLSIRARRCLYVAHKHWLFFGDETWWVCHPAIAVHAFGMSQQKLSRKLSKAGTPNQFYMPAGPSNEQRKAILYTCDDEQWKTARSELMPFFYKYDFGWIPSIKSICSALP
jgi:hypothetical protein